MMYAALAHLSCTPPEHISVNIHATKHHLEKQANIASQLLEFLDLLPHCSCRHILLLIVFDVQKCDKNHITLPDL